MKKNLRVEIALIAFAGILLAGCTGFGLNPSSSAAADPSPPIVPASNEPGNVSLQEEELVRNQGFEGGGSQVPQGWMRDLGSPTGAVLSDALEFVVQP